MTDRVAELEARLAARDRQDAANRERSQIGQAFNAVERMVNDAERALADAFDDGDGKEIAAAQRKLGEATAKKERWLAENHNTIQRITGKAPDTSNLDAWKSKHESWYGVDAEMTKAVHEIDRSIRAAGTLEPGSNQYFEAVDRQMAARYPDRLGGAPMSATTTPGTGGMPPSNGGLRFGKDTIAAWKRMGINTDDPETLKRMAGHRAGLVQKGILPQEPVRGPVNT